MRVRVCALTEDDAEDSERLGQILGRLRLACIFSLKVFFRPISMMIPDYALIAELMLFAEGFDNAQALSKKMVKLYKLASEQLPQQDHDD